jgi:hypothetical protein
MTSRCVSQQAAVIVVLLAEAVLLQLVLVAGNRAVHISKHGLDGGAGAQGIAKTSPLLSFENALGRNGSLRHRRADARLWDARVLRLPEVALILNNNLSWDLLA